LQIKVSYTYTTELLLSGTHKNGEVLGSQTAATLMKFIQVIGPSFLCILDR